MGLLFVILLSWYKIRWVIYCFIVSVPLVSGLQAIGFMQGAPLLSFAFASIYLSWLPKRLSAGSKGITPHSVVGNLLDILSAIVLLSLIMSLSIYPLRFVLEQFRHAAVSQSDPFFCINAGYILLQGLFFFRIIELEINQKDQWHRLIQTVYLQAMIIIIFSVLQAISHIPPLPYQRGICSPFNDIHSYGGYIVLMFFVFLNLTFEIKNNRFFYNFLAVIFFLFILLSASSATLIAFFVVGCAFIAYKFKIKRAGAVFSILLAFFLFINFFPSIIPKTKNPILKRYTQRVIIKSALSKLTYRFYSWEQACGIIKEFPITGYGIGSYYRVARLYHSSYKSSSNRYSIENAHNYYLQFCADLGIPALLLFIFIIIHAYTSGISSINRGDEYKAYMPGLLFGLSAYLITMMTNHHLILSNQQFLFWFVISAITIPSTFAKEHIVSIALAKHLRFFLVLLVLIFAIGFGYRLFTGKDALKKYEYGFYDDGIIINNDNLRWTMHEACERITANSSLIGIKVYAAPANISKSGLKFDLFIDNQLLDQIHFMKSGVKTRYYYLPSVKGNTIEIKTTVNNTFNPYTLGLTDDLSSSRDQGVAISPIQFLHIMPRNGIGFYNKEVHNNEPLNGCPKNKVQKIRQTTRCATINLMNNLSNDGTVYLRCEHPDINSSPVNVVIKSDNTIIFQKIFRNHKWTKVLISPDDVKGAKGLTFQVSRTWNPKSLGVSEEDNEFGLTLAICE